MASVAKRTGEGGRAGEGWGELFTPESHYSHFCETRCLLGHWAKDTETKGMFYVQGPPIPPPQREANAYQMDVEDRKGKGQPCRNTNKSSKLPFCFTITEASPWLSGKEPACQCRGTGFDSWVEKMPFRRKWQPAPVFLPGESPWTEVPGGLHSLGWQSRT